MQRTGRTRRNVRHPVVVYAEIDVTFCGIVVAVECDGQTLLSQRASRVTGSWWSLRRLSLRVRRGMTEGHAHVVMIGALRCVVHIGLVDQGDVVDGVRDDEFWVRLEIVNGVARVLPLDAVVEGTTESFHHPDLYIKGAG